MKNSIKLIAAAALVATSGFASAAIDDGVASGNGELFFRAYDSTTTQSYYFDTGLTMLGFTATGATDKSFSLTNFSNFLSSVDSSTTIWGVYAVDALAAGAGTPKVGTYLTAADVFGTKPAQSKVGTINAELRTAINVANIAAGDSADISANNYSTILGAGNNQIGPISLTAAKLTFNGNMTSAAAALLSDTSQSFYQISAPSVSTSVVTQFANANGVSSWNLNTSTGTLSFVTAPVPEPSTYALAIAGLAVVGALSRRNKKAAK